MSQTESQKLPDAFKEALKTLDHVKPDRFELYYLKKTATKIDCKNQKVDTLSRSEDVGLSIRMLKGQRMGFSYTTSLEPRAIEKAVRAAGEIAELMPRDEYASLESFLGRKYPEVLDYDEKGLARPVEEKIAQAMKVEAECKKIDSRIKAVRSASFSEVAFESHLLDTEKNHLFHRGTRFTSSITCKAEEGGDNQIGGDFGFSTVLQKLDPVTVARNGAAYATELLGAKQAPTMRCPAVFRNSVVADLIDFLSPSFSAESVDKGRSMLAGKFGEKLISEAVSLLDDGLLPDGFSTSPFDGEGYPQSTTALIENGRIVQPLYDSYYARKMKARPTGSAERGIKSPPSIGFSNLYIPRGEKSFDELLDGISRGILITDLMGVHTANPVTGDFSLGASGILIADGKLTTPVRGFAVAGNVLELFRRMTDTGSDLRFFGNVGAPSVRVSEISVGGS